jgi:hypothetical protein
MARPRKRKPKPHETTLQSLFVKRVLEEMGDISISKFCERVGAPPQTSLNDVLNFGAVPGLTLVYQVATALDLSPWELLKEKPIENQEILTSKVRQLRQQPPPIFGQRNNIRTQGKIPAKNKARA